MFILYYILSVFWVCCFESLLRFSSKTMEKIGMGKLSYSCFIWSFPACSSKWKFLEREERKNSPQGNVKRNGTQPHSFAFVHSVETWDPINLKIISTRLSTCLDLPLRCQKMWTIFLVATTCQNMTWNFKERDTTLKKKTTKPVGFRYKNIITCPVSSCPHWRSCALLHLPSDDPEWSEADSRRKHT